MTRKEIALLIIQKGNINHGTIAFGSGFGCRRDIRETWNYFVNEGFCCPCVEVVLFGFFFWRRDERDMEICQWRFTQTMYRDCFFLEKETKETWNFVSEGLYKPWIEIVFLEKRWKRHGILSVKVLWTLFLDSVDNCSVSSQGKPRWAVLVIQSNLFRKMKGIQ